MVAVELEVMAKKLDRFGWERDRNSYAHDRMVIDWMDALQDYPLDEVRDACRAYVRENPGKMPNEGHIVAAILAARKAAIAHLPRPETHEPPKERVSKEAAMEILARAGFPVKRMAKD
jgi:hypothetical protein